MAVVGGGCASLTTAFELTRPEHRGRYQVTVYQMGWRLGGKGASGRGVADRIEEHGLHLWMGFYENAFRIMRECYAELAESAGNGRRMTDWRDAFSPAPDVAVTDHGGDGWEFWLAKFPPSPGLPGDSIQVDSPFTVRRYLLQSVGLLVELIRSANAMEAERRHGADADGWQPTSAPGPWSPEGLDAAVDMLLRYGQLTTATAVFQGADLLLQLVRRWVPAPVRATVEPQLRLVDALAATARIHLERMVGSDGELRRVWQVIDLILASIRGVVVDGLVADPRGFDAINDYDWREWLRLNGASEQSLESGFLRAIYGLVFAFEDGDVERPRLAAGVALRGALRMFFTYRGALFWKMNGGMGDIVFAPLYEVLRGRGVRFEFFHRLRNVKLGPARPGEASYVEALELDVQARVRGGAEYDPLVVVKGVPSWPATPRYEQLEDGTELEREGRLFESQWEERRAGTRTLRVGRDFDFVVLGVSIGALPMVAAELIDRQPKWREMVRHVKTVPTQAFQLWLREDVRALGWRYPPVSLSGFTEPFDTWADMRHLIEEESWTEPVKSIAYFCSVLPDPGTPNGQGPDAFHREQREQVRENAVRFLETEVETLWPDARRKRGGFRWGLLAEERNGSGDGPPPRDSRRFESQHWTANVDPSERYVLSLPGSCRYRVSPLDMSFDNLTVAGDWTATGLDSGCIESAVISGRLAAHALSHQPPLTEIVGYDHP